MSQSTIFLSCWENFLSSWVEPVLSVMSASQVLIGCSPCILENNMALKCMLLFLHIAIKYSGASLQTCRQHIIKCMLLYLHIAIKYSGASLQTCRQHIIKCMLLFLHTAIKYSEASLPTCRQHIIKCMLLFIHIAIKYSGASLQTCRQHIIKCMLLFLRRLRRRSIITLNLNFMQIFANQKYS